MHGKAPTTNEFFRKKNQKKKNVKTYGSVKKILDRSVNIAHSLGRIMLCKPPVVSGGNLLSVDKLYLEDIMISTRKMAIC